MPTRKVIAKVKHYLWDKVLMAGHTVTIDQVILGINWIEYRVWYMSQDALAYSYVTEDKLSWESAYSRIGFLISD